MKTWVFTEQDLPAEIDLWVEKQKATGHPAAIKHADFIGTAIMDFLYEAQSLQQTESDALPAPEREQHVEPDPQAKHEADLNNMDDLKRLFETGFSEL